MSFARTLDGWRYVDTHHGDTLQRIAARELGDAGRWYELISLNGLTYPYLTDDPALASDTVLLTGSAIMIPAAGQAGHAGDPMSVFGQDVALPNGQLQVNNGDLATLSGVDNLSQALRHNIDTEPGDLLFHPRYGCGAHHLLGRADAPANALLAEGYIRRSLSADPRVASVRQVTVAVQGDVLAPTAVVEAVNGQNVIVESSNVSG